MELKDIGFYTLSNARALNASSESPLWRCELILTDKCNFKCPYCRGLHKDITGTMPMPDAMRVLGLWIDQGLKNVRFSGGEPTLYHGLESLVERCRIGGVEGIAISTNGSASTEYYVKLANAGVNDFSISLDGGCCQVAEKMTGVHASHCFDNVVENIKVLSKLTYVTVGMVFDENNIDRCVESVQFVDSLGVSDIRVIPAAQYNKALQKLAGLSDTFLLKYPILKYRINNIRINRPVRGIHDDRFTHCWLALDDMAVAGKYHFPCIIYLREGGRPIGVVSENMRRERLEWVQRHNPRSDAICSKNCLDVCVDHCTIAEQTH